MGLHGITWDYMRITYALHALILNNYIFLVITCHSMLYMPLHTIYILITYKIHDFLHGKYILDVKLRELQGNTE
jgi:hypothetical protein